MCEYINITDMLQGMKHCQDRNGNVGGVMHFP